LSDIKVKISIVVPLYNMEKIFNICMESLLKQTIEDIEIIIIDDGSTDNSGRMADEYAETNQNVVVVHQENGGLSAARNTGIDRAEGKYIAFVDSDDYVAHDMMKVLYDEAEVNSADLAICNFYRDNIATADKSEVKGFAKAGLYDNKEALKMFLARRITGHAWNKLFRRRIFIERNIRFPVNRLYEDFPTIGKFLVFSQTIVCVDRPLYYYVQRVGSITDNQSIKGINDTIQGAMEVYHMVKEQRPKMEEFAAFYLSTNAIDCKVMESKLLDKTKELEIERKKVGIQISNLWRYASGKIYLKNAGGYYKICWLIYKLGLLRFVVKTKDRLNKK